MLITEGKIDVQYSSIICLDRRSFPVRLNSFISSASAILTYSSKGLHGTTPCEWLEIFLHQLYLVHETCYPDLGYGVAVKIILSAVCGSF
jgi:hypothetical protein